MRVEVTKRAQREINRLGRWWLEHREKAPELFEEELSATYSLIATEPSVGKMYLVSRGRRILRVLTGKTKNHVYYYQHEPGVIRVVSVWGAVPRTQAVAYGGPMMTFDHNDLPSSWSFSASKYAVNARPKTWNAWVGPRCIMVESVGEVGCEQGTDGAGRGLLTQVAVEGSHAG